MRLTYAGRFDFEGRGRAPARCSLRIWRSTGQLPVVIATELPDNTGATITQAAGLVATQAWQRLLPDAREGFIWIERSPERPSPAYLPDDPRYAELLELVEFTPLGQDIMYLREPHQRRRLARSAVEQLVGALPMAPDEV
jgi:hypothetical protein